MRNQRYDKTFLFLSAESGSIPASATVPDGEQWTVTCMTVCIAPTFSSVSFGILLNEAPIYQVIGFDDVAEAGICEILPGLHIPMIQGDIISPEIITDGVAQFTVLIAGYAYGVENVPIF